MADTVAMVARTGIHGFVDDLAEQRQLLRGRMPAYQRVLDTVGGLLTGPDADATFAARLARAWQSRGFAAFYDRPLLLLASLRADALADGASHPLHDAVGDGAADPAAVTLEAVRDATATARLGFWTAMSTRRVQTNETLRAVAWMLPARLGGANGGARPLVLVDIGASAGLNLIGDALPAPWTDAAGAPLAVASGVRTVARVGLDARPLDVNRDDDVAWLRACLWPTETERLARFAVAVRALRGALGRAGGPTLERTAAASAPRRIADLAAAAPRDALVLAYQTFVSGYFADEERAAYEQAMRALLVSQPEGRVAWIEMEIGKAASARNPAELRAHVRAAGGAIETLLLARCGYHPIALDVVPAALARLATLLAPPRG